MVDHGTDKYPEGETPRRISTHISARFANVPVTATISISAISKKPFRELNLFITVPLSKMLCTQFYKIIILLINRNVN